MKKPISVTIKFYGDAGHGWYAAKRFTVAALGLLDKISQYSYQRGQTVYLEEDSDATKFFNAAKAIGLNIIVKEGKHIDRSPIRSYDRFQP